MVANKDYWRGAPKVDEVIFQTYQNQDTMAQDLKTGAIQTGWNIPSAQFEPLGAEPDLTSIRAVTIGFDQLGFNCADKKIFPKSTGHPVLQDPAFRSALQWAVDKDKIVSIGYNGNAAPADTIITRDFYSAEADFHWTPPVGDPGTYTFDLEKAKAALDAAGYTDGDGNGIREYKGKDIKLRLYARSESPESQNCGKLITGWFEEVGLDIDYQVIDDGALGDKQYNYEGDQYAPDFDLFIWGWGGDVDPNFILSVLTTGSIEAWSDCIWSNAEYDKLFLEQQTTIDVAEAHRTRPPDAADRLRGVAVHPAGLPPRPRGGQHHRLDRLGARQPEQGRLVVQHPAGHLPGRAAGRRGRRDRELEHRPDRGHRDRRDRRGARHRPPRAPAWRAVGGRGLSSRSRTLVTLEGDGD